jgi:hypothetical protein
MKIMVENARALAASLTSAAAGAQATGQKDFDLLDALGALDDAAREQLATAIAHFDHCEELLPIGTEPSSE